MVSDNAELSDNRNVTCYPTIVKYHQVQILVKVSLLTLYQHFMPLLHCKQEYILVLGSIKLNVGF